MRKTQIMVNEEQLRQLRQLANRRGISVAQVIREALDDAVDRQGVRDAAELRRNAAAAAGRFRSGRRDVAERHDDELAEAYRS